jgi:LacI family transcriptional regulator
VLQLPHKVPNPTLKTVATSLGIGVTTVARALKNDPKISAKTRASVRQMADQLGYRPNRAGLRLRTGKTNVISLVLDTHEQVGSFVSEMIFGITEALADTPYHLIVTPYSSLKDSMEPIRYLVETASVDGIIISRIEPDDARVRYMIDHEMPFATHGRTFSGLQHAYFDFDNEAFARIAVKRLASLGRKRMALLGPPADLSFHDHMRQGFTRALAECCLTEIPIENITNDDSMQLIRKGIRHLFSQDLTPDGLIVSSGGVSGTGGALLAIFSGLADVGAVVGRDVDIVTKQIYKDMPFLTEQYHVVHEDVREAGRELAKSLIGVIDGEPVAKFQRLAVPTQVTLHAPEKF